MPQPTAPRLAPTMTVDLASRAANDHLERAFRRYSIPHSTFFSNLIIYTLIQLIFTIVFIGLHIVRLLCLSDLPSVTFISA
jgi:hypothetical protein